MLLLVLGCITVSIPLGAPGAWEGLPTLPYCEIPQLFRLSPIALQFHLWQCLTWEQFEGNLLPSGSWVTCVLLWMPFLLLALAVLTTLPSQKMNQNMHLSETHKPQLISSIFQQTVLEDKLTCISGLCLSRDRWGVKSPSRILRLGKNFFFRN